MDVQGITIDGKGARERDDSIWSESDSRGWTITVCIANVARAVVAGSPADVDARRRVEMRYLPGGRVRPLLPDRLIDCSIAEGQSRRVMAVRIRLDHELEPQFVAIDESELVSSGQLSYDQIPKIMSDDGHPLNASISSLAKLASGLVEKRRRAGAFVLYDLEAGWVMSEEGSFRRLNETAETFGYIMVQEIMILANSELAKFCSKNNITVPYRNHTAVPSALDLVTTIGRVSSSLSGSTPDLEFVREQVHLAMGKASYGHVSGGHFGLNLPDYLHGTSPLRRYADLVCQRQILAAISGAPPPHSDLEVREISEHMNATANANAKKVTNAFAEQANRRAGVEIQKDDLSHLSESEFKRVIKVSVRSGEINQVVMESFLRKLSNGTATLVDMHFILFKSGDEWRGVRASIVDHLAEFPFKGTSIITIASQVDGWSAAKYKIQSGGAGALVMHTASVYFRKPGVGSQKTIAPTVKLAKHRAVVETIALAVGEAPPIWPDNTVQVDGNSNDQKGGHRDE